jgi:PBP1b-binding outer membrane lipoprotein LpoB
MRNMFLTAVMFLTACMTSAPTQPVEAPASATEETVTVAVDQTSVAPTPQDVDTLTVTTVVEEVEPGETLPDQETQN